MKNPVNEVLTAYNIRPKGIVHVGRKEGQEVDVSHIWVEPEHELDAFFREKKINGEEYNFLNMNIEDAEQCLKGSVESLRFFDYVYTNSNSEEMDCFLDHFGFHRVSDSFYIRH